MSSLFFIWAHDPFSHWSAVSHSKSRDLRISSHFQFRWRHFRSCDFPLSPSSLWSVVSVTRGNPTTNQKPRIKTRQSGPYGRTLLLSMYGMKYFFKMIIKFNGSKVWDVVTTAFSFWMKEIKEHVLPIFWKFSNDLLQNEEIVKISFHKNIQWKFTVWKKSGTRRMCREPKKL